MTSLTFDTTEVFILSANPAVFSSAGSLALTEGWPSAALLPAFAVAAILVLLAAVAREAGLAAAVVFAAPPGAGATATASADLLAGFVSLPFMMPPPWNFNLSRWNRFVHTGNRDSLYQTLFQSADKDVFR
ncbi:hypothetical protein [Massilia soli]|uniref:Uncharacterized protein n=1 Tax=Massilia soli TaxID=2792854 RepID=A0ABS7SJM2_9BURK|nr:hypothetical protein [Massilia soli]MBZ2206015.1 hypothetical protein [Massilia soli]